MVREVEAQAVRRDQRAAIVNALSHQLIRWSFDQPDSQPWLDFWPMFVGDAIGALAILYAVKFSIAGLRRLERTQP